MADEVIFSNDFDDGKINEWQEVRNQQWHNPEKPCFNGGNPTNWEIDKGKLGITINGSPCTTEIIPQNLDLSEINNYEFEFDWQFLESTHMDRNILIKWQDESNWYGLHIMDNKLLLQKIINGQLESLYDNWGYFEFEADQEYHFKIIVANNLITVWINDNQIFQTLDRSPYLTGFKTLGLQASTGDIFRSISFFDNLIVRSLDILGEKRLGVPLYKQHDPEWKRDEYDHAKEWAKKYTLQRWGCALTSATMILNFHGIDQLPSGRQLNPSKLNQWLKNQPDGFIGEGLLNWLAISRLSQLMNEELDTPVLEYRWLDGNLLTAISEIENDKPVILQTPGHFFVADGYRADKLDLFIKDPAYSYDLFSQHQTEIESIRSFTPSQTDLSYILIVHDPEADVTLINESGLIPTELKIYSEYIQDPVDQTQTKIKIIQSFAKPESGKYLLKIIGDGRETNEIEIFSYDVDGNVIDLSQEILKTQLFTLNFEKDKDSQLIEITNQFTLFREKIKTLYKSGEITTKYAYLKLDQLATYAEENEDNQERYKKLIINSAYKLEGYLPYLVVIRNLAPSS